MRGGSEKFRVKKASYWGVEHKRTPGNPTEMRRARGRTPRFEWDAHGKQRKEKTHRGKMDSKEKKKARSIGW